MLSNFQRKTKSVNVISHSHRETSLPPCEDVRLTRSSQKQSMCELQHMSLYECPSLHIRKAIPIFPFHFRHRDIFCSSEDIFPFNKSWTWKATAKFLWKCFIKQQIYLWLAYPKASFIFSVLLISTMRKIHLCQCFQGAFNSGLSQNLAALSRCSSFQPSLVHVS